MRMRKKKNGEARLEACRELLVKKPELIPGKEVFLEIGAGKGGFAVGMCSKHRGVQYFAMEKVSDCVVLAAEKAKEMIAKDGSCENLCFLIDNADNLTSLFPSESVDRIFLNFSDPWSKKGYAKRRLTHRRYLAVYMQLLKNGGSLRFKTDNVPLFNFTLDELSAVGLDVNILTRDLHSSPWAEDNVVTEYEAAFSAQGISINMLEVTKPVGFSMPIEESLLPGRREYVSRASE